MTIALPSPAIEAVPIDYLRPDPANPRRIGDGELEALTRSLRQFGFVQPILARREDSVVVGGHQRLVAARRLGMATVPVIWLDLPVEQTRLLGLALNKISGSWDEELLARLLAELQATTELDLTLSGFGEDEVAGLLRSLSAWERRDRPESFDLDAALEEATRVPRSKFGDLWTLGDHRLLCGDATKREDIEQALGGRQAALGFTDPPYGVRYDGGPVPSRRRRTHAIANDALDPVAWEAFSRAWARNLLEAVDGAIYVCMSSKEWPTVATVLADEGGRWSDTVIWAKDRFTLGRADYQRGYEPLWFGWREGSEHHWCGDRDQSDVWHIPRPAESPLHPTMKPLALMERAIENSSRPGDLCLDPFVGSGSTLIACERTDRACAAIELDPIYVDVTLTRWERFTGRTAEKVDG